MNYESSQHGGLNEMEDKIKMAVSVGYRFQLLPYQIVANSGVKLKKTCLKVSMAENTYPLYVGEEFADSQIVDMLLDKHGEKEVEDYLERSNQFLEK